ncbi:MAG: 16S rRNA (uracil(1498)-N(3))-methyltransferase [Planctomycetia bacterium]|nr:16S rRNA (uracil(1498)-N(3))-methyltransferase [Planctomycetia bacterium]
MSERFYVNCPLEVGPTAIQGAEAHHLAVVCRLRPGDAVCLFNGDGREYHAVILEAGKRTVELDVQRIETPERELPFRLEVAVPLPKGDRAQVLVEKLTELGVHRLVPLRTARSVVHPGDAKRGKLERWVIEASKQCGRNLLLEVAPLTDWASYCERDDLPRLRWLAHPAPDGEVSLTRSRSDRVIAVGPEGGFTEEEVERAVSLGWQRVGLGPRILRVETAAITLAALCALSDALER